MLITGHKSLPLTVYIHWGETGSGECTSSSAETFDQAFAAALRNMVERQTTAEAA
ncbi:hypothetical protein [Aminobacter ciceronei]|uniref:Uncharacterized protein n=2 Tax=Aminobacter ciceronei TaxID=150723 RepID=A0ABR6C0Q2_9HYPH|nr:hypothetical protein [Aminobacter ciceronei]MBA8904890.1 hypothetical protein [Aminobacter ciceronei]MBA9018556.1 hypothetical protein [Aminobacter ciceronei]